MHELVHLNTIEAIPLEPESRRIGLRRNKPRQASDDWYLEVASAAFQLTLDNFSGGSVFGLYGSESQRSAALQASENLDCFALHCSRRLSRRCYCVNTGYALERVSKSAGYTESCVQLKAGNAPANCKEFFV